MLFIGWIGKSHRDQNEEDEERPSYFNKQLQGLPPSVGKVFPEKES